MREVELPILRKQLGLSRSELARFLGISEATVLRWETGRNVSEPSGLQAVLLSIVQDAARYHPHKAVARAIRASSMDYRQALRNLLELSEVQRPASPERRR